MKRQRWSRPHFPSDLSACYGEIAKEWKRAEDAEIERDRLAEEVERLSSHKADQKAIADRIGRLEEHTAKAKRIATRERLARWRRERRA